jgi:threonine/homoserine efflux transporter RhtA
VTDGLANAIIIASLVLAAWGLLTAALNRPAGRSHLLGLGLLEAALIVQVVVAVVKVVDGERPGQPATFVGYLVASLLVLPIGAALALMERSRWGAVIVGVASLVIPVLIVRLQQVWGG